LGTGERDKNCTCRLTNYRFEFLRGQRFVPIGQKCAENFAN